MENELHDMNAMKDAIEANWESSLYDLNETRNLAEIERNEYHKLKLMYTDLLDLKNAIEAKGWLHRHHYYYHHHYHHHYHFQGNAYEAKYESLSAQFEELQQLQQQQQQQQLNMNTAVPSNDTDNDNTFTTSYCVDTSKPKVIVEEKGNISTTTTTTSDTNTVILTLDRVW